MSINFSNWVLKRKKWSRVCLNFHSRTPKRSFQKELKCYFFNGWHSEVFSMRIQTHILLFAKLDFEKGNKLETNYHVNWYKLSLAIQKYFNLDIRPNCNPNILAPHKCLPQDSIFVLFHGLLTSYYVYSIFFWSTTFFLLVAVFSFPQFSSCQCYSL